MMFYFQTAGRPLPKEAPIKSVLTPMKPNSGILPPLAASTAPPANDVDEMAMASQLEELATAYTQITESVAVKAAAVKRPKTEGDDDDGSSPSKKYRQEISDLLREHEVMPAGSSLSSSDEDDDNDDSITQRQQQPTEEKTVHISLEWSRT